MIPLDLNDKVALVTGVTAGIGAGIAAVLAEAGCHVAGCGRSDAGSEGARVFSKNVASFGRKSLYVKADITRESDIRSLVDQTASEFGKIDILISNAGVNVFRGARDCSTRDFDYNTDLNLKSHWLISQYCRENLAKSDNGLIVIITSNHAYRTIPGCFPYNVTKAALVGLVNALALEWGPEIRVIGLAPGFIETESGERYYASFRDPFREKQSTINRHPLKRLGTVAEIGGICAFLATEYARFISGTTFLVDGGRSAVMQDEA